MIMVNNIKMSKYKIKHEIILEKQNHSIYK